MTNFTFSVNVASPIDEAIEQLKVALSHHALGVVSDVDLQGIIKKKLEEEITGYRILDVCNPKVAKSIIEKMPEAGTLLPCTVVVRESNGETVFDFMDPVAILSIAGDDFITDVAAKVTLQLKAAAAELGTIF